MPRPPSPIRRAWSNRGFRRLFLAHTVSRWGDTFNTVALVVLVFRLTGSGARVAATVGFEIAPVLLFGLAAGAAADRLPRRRVMVAADVGRALVALALVAGQSRLWAVYAAAFGLSALTQVFNPAAASVVPDLVDEADLVGANSALWSAAVVSQVALAPLAGVLVAAAGAGPAFVVNAATFAVSALLLRGLALPDRPVSPEGRPARRFHLVREGVAAVRASPRLRALAGVQAMAALSAGATSALLVVLAERHLGAGPGRFGLLLAAIAVGAGFGPLVLQRLMRDARRPAFLFGPYLLRGFVDLVLAASSSFAVAAAALGAYGVGTSTGAVAYQSYLQTVAPERSRGRIFAFFDVVWQSGRLTSVVLGGVLADAIGIRAVYASGGVLLLGAGAFGWARLGGLDSSEAQRLD